MSLRGNKTSIKSRGNSGQAAIEYILLLAITIAVILLFKEFYKQIVAPKLNYALGGYIECLLETGQLPSIRDTTASQNLSTLTNNDSKCKLPTGTFSGLGGSNGSGGTTGGPGGASSGNSSSGTTSSGSSGSNSGGSSGASGSGPNSGSSGSNSTTKVSGPGAGSQASSYNPRNSNSGYNSGSGNNGSGANSGGAGGEGDERDNPTRKKRSTPIGYAKDRRQVLAIRDGLGITGADGGLGPGEGKTKEKENSSVDEMGDEYGRGGRRGRTGARYRSVNGAMQAEYEKQEEQKARIITTGNRKRTTAAPEEFGRIEETRRKVDPPPPRAVASLEEVESEGIGFGSIFKYLLIAGIVIAIIVFFGSQVMNYNNSQEK